jgi:isopentenyl-diphosphate delta-isomerase
MMNNQVVSFDDEKLILVDENDNVLGYEIKAKAHENDGMLHRAFSLFIFNDKKELLIQRRSRQKPLWPIFWANSVCSHPRKGEDYDTAVHRRLKEELGIETHLHFLYKFQYQARFDEVGSENELCSVYIGKSEEEIITNPNEIAEWKFVDLTQLKFDIAENPGKYTPWLKMELEKIRGAFMQEIENL